VEARFAPAPAALALYRANHVCDSGHAELITGINSTLPCKISGQVSHVYDTATGKHLLVPQGTKLEGIKYLAYQIRDHRRAWAALRQLSIMSGNYRKDFRDTLRRGKISILY
jgi:hypothetical protein